MQQQGTSQPGMSSLLGQSQVVNAAPRSRGPSALQAGQALSRTAGPARPMGNFVAPTTTGRIPAGAANRGQPWSQRPGQAMRGVRVTAQAVTVTEGESGGDHDASNYTYTVVPWSPNATESADVHMQTHLEPGDPVFVQTLTVQKYRLFNMLSLGQLNSVLRDNRVVFLARYAKGNADAVRFADYLERYGENMLRLYHEARQCNTMTHLSIGLALEQDMAALKDFYRMSTHKDYYAMTLFGIMQTWNFVGFVLTTSDPLRIKGMQKLGYARVLSVNVTVKGEFQAALQVWKGYKHIPAQSKLYFILTRVETSRGPGAFQFVPWGSRERESCPRSIIQYRDDSGMLCDGYQIFVGTVNLAPNKMSSEITRKVAAGLIADTPHMQREAGAQLTRHNGQLRVEVGIF